MIGIGILGCAGRMGRLLAAEVAASPEARLAAGTASAEQFQGCDLGTLVGLEPFGVFVSNDPAALFAASDVVIDFTAPAATRRHAALAAASGTPLVIGTTGLDGDDLAAIASASRHCAILRAANMSLGVNLLLGLVEQAARALGPDWDIEILEMHHRHKVDAPSGTALALGEAAARGRDIPLSGHEVRVRDGQTGPRPAGAIGFATLRGGDVVGDHSVIFAGPGERLELGHRAGDRRIFARGAVRAALWLAGRTPGLYGMGDVLGLGSPAA
jgi:4-hydroxy-tetrahydrodipicolinate reductase